MNTARIFTIAGSVTLNNLTMINATSKNSATHGGAITHSGGSLEINDCVFDNCKAVNSAGSTYYEGGAVYTTGTRLTVKGSKFSNSKGSSGGAISAKCPLTVDGSSFTSCSATDAGAALYTNNKLTVTNSTFIKCSSLAGTVTVVNSNYASTISSSVFLNNSASSDWGSVVHTYATGGARGSTEIVDCIIMGNTNYAFSSLVDSGSATITANNNWFGNNITNKNTKPVTTKGSVTLNQWLYLSADTNVTIYNYLFRNESVLMNFNLNHYATTSSNGTYNATNLPSVYLTLTSTNGELNTTNVTINRGASNDFIFTSTNNYSNASVTATYPGYVSDTHYFKIIPDDSYCALAKLIDEAEDVLNLTHGYHYYPEYDGNWINGVPISKALTVNAVNCTISGMNTARIFTIKGNVVLNNLTLVNATSKNSVSRGGAITHSGGSLEINDCVFDNCKAVNSAGSTYYEGGAVYTTGTRLTVKGSKFSNSKGSSGGAISAKCPLTVDGSSFTSCSATDAGAALYTNNKLTVTNSTFIKCSSLAGTVTVVNSNYASTISSSVFLNNSASSDWGSVVHTYATGGARGSTEIVDCIIMGNTNYAFSSLVDSGSATITANNNWFGNNITNKNTKPVTTKGSVTLNQWLYIDMFYRLMILF